MPHNSGWIRVDVELILEIDVLKSEVILESLAPASFIVEIDVGSLVFVFAAFERRRRLRPASALRVFFEPREVLLVVPPVLPLQFSCREVLLLRALLVVENEEERVVVQLFELLWSRKQRAGWKMGRFQLRRYGKRVLRNVVSLFARRESAPETLLQQVQNSHPRLIEKLFVLGCFFLLFLSLGDHAHFPRSIF